MSAFLQMYYSKPINSTADKFLYGSQMLLIGMAVVFAALVLLWLSLEVLRILCNRMKGNNVNFSLSNLFARREPKPEVPEPKPTMPSRTSASTKAASACSAAADDSEIVAVIAAAIAASENDPIGSFRVVSFRRV